MAVRFVPFSTRLPESLRREMRRFCARKEVTTQQFVIEAIADSLDRQRTPASKAKATPQQD